MVSYSVHFDGIPKDATLTLGMDVPGSWLVRPERSPYDLDNIKLSKIPASSNLEAEFLLQSILVEGHASDSKTNGPPRGLQFVLGTSTNH
jgi:UDP-glucose:glycoprotein glucosyltransferase